MEQRAIQPAEQRKRPRRERGTGRIWQNGKIWWIQYYDMQRRQVRESSRSSTKGVADHLLRRRLGEKAAGLLLPLKSQRLRYEEMRDAFYAEYLHTEKKSLRVMQDGTLRVCGVPYLDKFFARNRASEITTDRIRAFIAKRQKEGASNATVNRPLAALRRMFTLAVRDGELRQNDIPYVPMLKEPPPRKGFLKHDQYLCLRDALADHLKLLLAAGYYTGMRLGEILRLKWDQVDLRDGMFNLYTGETKNDEPRTIPLADELRKQLAIQKLKHDVEFPGCELVFVRNGKPIGNFNKAWNAACIKADLGMMVFDEKRGREKYHGLIFHDLRRSGVRNLMRAGVSQDVAMSISGHKTATMFRRYNIVSRDDLKDAARKLDAYLGEKKGASKGQIASAQESSPEEIAVTH